MRKERKQGAMTIDWNITTAQQHVSAAWRAAAHPEAITEAVTMGEQVSELLTRAAHIVGSASRNVDTLVDHTPARCQVILDRLTIETDRLTPMVRRLRAAAKAVAS